MDPSGLTGLIQEFAQSANGTNDAIRAAVGALILTLLYTAGSVLRKLIPAIGTFVGDTLKSRAEKQAEVVKTIKELNEFNARLILRLDDLEEQIEKLTENQRTGQHERDELQAKYDDLNARYTESERLLKANADAELKLRLEAEAERDTLRLEKTSLIKQIDDMKGRIESLETEVAELKSTTNGVIAKKGDTGPLPSVNE